MAAIYWGQPCVDIDVSCIYSSSPLSNSFNNLGQQVTLIPEVTQPVGVEPRFILNMDSSAWVPVSPQSLLLPNSYNPVTLDILSAQTPILLSLHESFSLMLLVHCDFPLSFTDSLYHFLSHYLVLFSLWPLPLSDTIWHCFTLWIVNSMENTILLHFVHPESLAPTTAPRQSRGYWRWKKLINEGWWTCSLQCGV
jgi:hypothetical protein